MQIQEEYSEVYFGTNPRYYLMYAQKYRFTLHDLHLQIIIKLQYFIMLQYSTTEADEHTRNSGYSGWWTPLSNQLWATWRSCSKEMQQNCSLLSRLTLLLEQPFTLMNRQLIVE